MKLFLLKLSILIFAQSLIAQPNIEWQKTYGGDNLDVLYAFERTLDGGYILGGYSTSGVTGEKSAASRGQIDLWIIKTNAAGTIVWQRSYGGALDDYITNIKPTSDGGYIVGAGSNSGISGDKTVATNGALDYWVLKLNSSGDIVWQKSYGGTQPDFDSYIQQLADSSYVIAGYSDSNISGNKTDATNGQRDYWIIKLDTIGNISWQNSIGGSLVDRIQKLILTDDGGYLLAGYSTSGISGDKSDNSRGGYDNWIVKLSNNGTIQWNKTYGGTADDILRSVIQTGDGGYLLGGYSHSGIGGDKTDSSRNGSIDYWVIKINSTGTVEWQKTIGGSSFDYLRDIKQFNNNYWIFGYSNSPVSGDKTIDTIGGYDNWIIELNASGSILNQYVFGGDMDESGPYALVTPDNKLIVASSSASGISGNKTEATRGLEDYWVVKFNEVLTRIKNDQSAFSAKIFPNPSANYFRIEIPASDFFYGKNYCELI